VINSTNASNNAGTGTYDDNAANFRIPTYICPSDGNAPSEGVIDAVTFPTALSTYTYDLATPATAAAVSTGSFNWGTNSYAANWLVFGNILAPRMPDSIPDGTSKTVLFTEKTPVCSSATAVGGNLWAFPAMSISANGVASFFPPNSTGAYDYAGLFGYYPYGSSTYTSTGSWGTNPFLLPETGLGTPTGGITFQSQPQTGNCDPRYPSSPHSAGINACFADGHVQLISTQISGVTWQAIMTPAPLGAAFGIPRTDIPGSDLND
jgi:prepilin-type processing-associated H-X9-DG protein